MQKEDDTMIRIYLDWNVITNLRKTENLTNNDDVITFQTLINVINSARDKLIIPYSNGHLNDLLKSYKKGERERVEQSLKFISLLTQDVCLAQYWNEEIAKWHYRNPKEYFASLIEEGNGVDTISFESILEPLKEFGLDKMLDMFKLLPHNINFEQLEQHNSSFLSFFKRAKTENSMYVVMQDFIDLMNEMKTYPVIYNKLRSVFKTSITLDQNIHNVDNVIEMLDKIMLKTMLNKSFTELYQDNTIIETSKNKDYSKIIGTFMQLDFVGYGSEKLTDKNQYDNLFNDALHCFYGAHCDFFITADKKTYKKTKAVYQNENILTQVFKPTEFIKYLKQFK